jgi:hypothetical protein
MEDQTVYTQRCIKDVGAFAEDALTLEDAIAASSISSLSPGCENYGDEIVQGLIASMREIGTNETRRSNISKLLV